MRQLNLNFAPHRTLRTRYVLVLVSVATAVYVGWRFYLANDWSKRADAGMVQLRAMQTDSSVPIGGTPKDGIRQRTFDYEHGITDRLSVPWDTIFRKLEATVNSDVILLDVESDATLGTIAFTAEARSLDAMLAYVRRLREGEVFHEVEVQSHKIFRNELTTSVRFRLRARFQVRQLKVANLELSVNENVAGLMGYNLTCGPAALAMRF